MKHTKSTILICPTCEGGNIRLGENLGIRYIHSYLTKFGFNADILECDFEQKNASLIAQEILGYDILGFSLNYYEQYISAKKILDNLASFEREKNESKHIIIAGGHYATFSHQFILKDSPLIDYIVLGEGEHVLLKLIEFNFRNIDHIPNVVFKDSNNSVLYSQMESTKPNIDSFPFPYRNKNSYFMGQNHFSIITSRGCYGNCAFCSVNSFSKISGLGKNWRLRSPENIVKEIALLHEKYSVKAISFLDSVFLGTDKFSRHRAVEIFDLLKKGGIKIHFSFECKANAVDENLFRYLKRFGLKNVFVGLESGSDRGLKIFNKQVTLKDNQKAIDVLKKLEIDSQFGFINFFPEMTYDDFWQNTLFLFKNGILTSKALASRLCIYHGTPYHERKFTGVEVFDDNLKVIYSFNDDRINSLFENIKKYTKLIPPYEIQIQKIIFNAQVNIADEITRHKHLQKAQAARNTVNNVLFYIAKELFLYNKQAGYQLANYKFEQKVAKFLYEIKMNLEGI